MAGLHWRGSITLGNLITKLRSFSASSRVPGLSEYLNEGGGFLIEYPDLPGCMSDGDTINEAIANGEDAVKCWISAAKDAGRPIPQPGALEQQSGKWVQRVPKSIHLQLVERAAAEGVSLNTLVIAIIAESLGKDRRHP